MSGCPRSNTTCRRMSVIMLLAALYHSGALGSADSVHKGDLIFSDFLADDSTTRIVHAAGITTVTGSLVVSSIAHDSSMVEAVILLLEQIERVGDILKITDTELSHVNLAQLKSVNTKLVIGDNEALVELNAPNLEYVGGFDFFRNSQVSHVLLPELTICKGDFQFFDNGALMTVQAELLTRVNGNLYVGCFDSEVGTQSISMLRLTALQEITGYVEIDC